MNRPTSLLTLAAAALLAGCVVLPQPPRPPSPPQPPWSGQPQQPGLADALHTRPLLTVRFGTISVSPEPIVVSLRDLKEPIVWRLPEGHRFPAEGGIEFLGIVVGAGGKPVPPSQESLKDPSPRLDRQGRQALECRVQGDDRREFACRFTARAMPGVYRYVIRVIDKAGRTLEWDPSMFAMD